MSDISKINRDPILVKNYYDLDLVTRLIGKELVEKFKNVWVIGSRSRGDYKYSSDFDFAIPQDSLSKRHLNELQDDLMNRYGVVVDLRQNNYYDLNNKGIKIIE